MGCLAGYRERGVTLGARAGWCSPDEKKGPRVSFARADRRRFLKARLALSAVVALTVLLAVACTPETAAPPPPAQATDSPISAAAPATVVSGPATKIRVSYPEGGAHLPLFYARDKGIFAKNGLSVPLQGPGGGPVAPAGLQTGPIQIVDITGSEVVSADAAGADIIIL